MAGDRDVLGGADPNYGSGNRKKRCATNSGGLLRSTKCRESSMEIIALETSTSFVRLTKLGNPENNIDHHDRGSITTNEKSCA